MRKLLILAALAAALLEPAAAQAHPLGNFTINRFSEIQPSGGRVYVLYVLDLAEIPTFQAGPSVRSEGRAIYALRTADSIARGLHLKAGGRDVPLQRVRQSLAFPPGQAGLRTTRLQVLLSTPPLPTGQPTRVEYRDENFADRIGWKEIIVKPGPAARVAASSVPPNSISDGLLSYPKDLLQSPLSVTSATATIVPGAGPGAAPTLLSPRALDQRVGVRAVTDSGFAKLIVKDHLSGGFVLLSLVLAAFWGAAHAFTPGHGKSVITAYLVGSRGTPRHALILGLTTTITHTIGVFALGLVTLALSQFILPEQLYPWLNLVSALLVVGVGASVLHWRLREFRHRRAHAHDQAQPQQDLHPHDHDDHAHVHSNDQSHHEDFHGHQGHAHRHFGSRRPHRHPESQMSMRTLIGVGISGGIIPCPTALVVLLAAISLHRVDYGIVLILAFSLGLAASITGIGMLAVTAKRLFDRVNFEGGLIRLLPAASALVIVGLGLAMIARALPRIV